MFDVLRFKKSLGLGPVQHGQGCQEACFHAKISNNSDASRHICDRPTGFGIEYMAELGTLKRAITVRNTAGGDSAMRKLDKSERGSIKVWVFNANRPGGIMRFGTDRSDVTAKIDHQSLFAGGEK